MEPALFANSLALAFSLAAAPTQDNAPVVLRIPPPAPANSGEQMEPAIVPPEFWAEKCDPWDDWDKPAPPFIVAPGTFYVGTCGITSLLVTTDAGNVLFDTGTQDGSKVVYANIRRIGANPRQTKLILTTHEHFDHVGGVAWIQRQTGAPVAALPIAASVIRSGKADPDDPQAGMHDDMVPSPFVISIADGEPIHVGEVTFTPIATPGHTPGGTSWHWETCRGGECTSIVYADSLSPVSSDTYRFSDHPDYVAKYRAGLDRIAALDCHILLTPHPSHSRMIERAATGTFEGGMTCAQYADAKTEALDARIAKETTQ